MDAFGDWYRRSRDAQALELPGVNTVVNAAHNVPLDMFAFGGWPLFITYLLIMGLGGLALVRTIVRVKSYDPILTVLTTAWFGYQLQSLISINQIGLAIWGWVLTGAVIAYERITRVEAQANASSSEKSKSSTKMQNSEKDQVKAMLTSSIFALIGLLLALPPYSGDSKWRSAQVSQSVQELEESMQATYFNPPNTMKYVYNIQVLEQSNLPDLARKYALEATSWNPESFDLWSLLYSVKNSSAEEKQVALENMKRLDPLNPDVIAAQ